MNETTTTVADETISEIIAGEVFGVLVVVVAAAVLMWILLRLFREAGERPREVTVALLLSLLTLTAIVGFIITSSDSLVQLAATGLGALAGAVTAAFSADERDKQIRALREQQPPPQPPYTEPTNENWTYPEDVDGT